MARAVADREMPLAQATSAVSLAQTDPARSLALATSVADARASGNEARAVALRAAGLALAELHRPADALRQLRRSVRLTAAAGLRQREGEARMSAAFVLCTLGRTRSALTEADRAESLLDGDARYRLQAQRGAILYSTGSTEAALAQYGTAITGLVRSKDRLWEAIARNNRGVLHAAENRLAAATRDLERAAELFGGLDMSLARAHIEHNLGFLAARGGDAVGALERYRRAEAMHRAAGVPPTLILITRAELLLGLRLADEAVQVARQAVELCAAARRAVDLAQARLVLAEAALVAGDGTLALSSAEDALRAFHRQGRTSWALVARWVRLEGRIATGAAPGPALLTESRRLAGQLDVARWQAFGLEARIAAARLAADLGRTAEARAELARAVVTGHRGPALTRARALYARALSSRLAGDRAGARRALQRATTVVSDYATALGSLDLRAGVAGHVADLTELGVRLALEDGSAIGVLRWSELGRGLTLTTRPAPPPDDAELAARLSELRQVLADLREATTAGADPRPLLRHQARVEEAVRATGRQSRGRSASRDPLPLRHLRDALGDRVLLSYVECAGLLYGVVVRDGRPAIAPLRPAAEVAAEVRSLLAGLRRLSGGYGAAGALVQRRVVVQRTAERLQRALLAPLGITGAGPAVVVVPAGPLHPLPWAVLPALAGRAVTVAPSAALWVEAEQRPRARADRVVLVAGPDLPGAAAEIAELATALPRATALTGPAATAQAVLSALDGADVAHVACHGEFRPENPLFSALRLADGPVTGYDLQRLRKVPTTVVLSACDAARTAVTPGEGLLGLSAALLSLGARTLVAPLVPVPDETTRTLAVAFHRRVAAGDTADVALAVARSALDGGVAGYATGAAFVCLGHG